MVDRTEKVPRSGIPGGEHLWPMDPVGGLGLGQPRPEQHRRRAGKRRDRADATVEADSTVKIGRLEPVAAPLSDLLRRHRNAADEAGEDARQGRWGERIDPPHHLADLVGGVVGVGDHRDLSPYAARALQHPLDGGLESPFLAAVLVCHLHQRRADAGLVDGVAVETVAVPHPLESRGHRGGRAVDHPTGLHGRPRDVRRHQFLEAVGVGRRRVVRAILVVADQESEVNRRCRVEEIAVRRLGKPDFGTGIADDHRHRRAPLGS